MKFTYRKLTFCLATLWFGLSGQPTQAFEATDGIDKILEFTTPEKFTRVLTKVAPYLPERLQHEIYTVELYLIINQFLNPNNNKPLKHFFEETIVYIQKHRSFIKTMLKPGLDDNTKEAVVNKLIEKLDRFKTGTNFEWIGLNFLPLLRNSFPDEQHPFIKKHLQELKDQLRRRIELNKNI